MTGPVLVEGGGRGVKRHHEDGEAGPAREEGIPGHGETRERVVSWHSVPGETETPSDIGVMTTFQNYLSRHSPTYAVPGQAVRDEPPGNTQGCVIYSRDQYMGGTRRRVPRRFSRLMVRTGTPAARFCFDAARTLGRAGGLV